MHGDLEMKTVRITDETHEELTKMMGEIMARKGKQTTYDETIMELIKIARGDTKPHEEMLQKRISES